MDVSAYDSNYFSDDETTSSRSSTESDLSAHREEDWECVVAATNLRLDPENLMYRAEGNSSLVVALKKDGKVIRILKMGKSENQVTSKSSTRDRLRDVVSFQDKVMRRILNNDFVDVPVMIHLEQKQVFLISSITDACRPTHRLDKHLPVGDTFALLLPDYCSLPKTLPRKFICAGPVISVEIKPKQGFLPAADSLPPELLVKSRVSRFCLKQLHGVEQGNISCRSDYCPLDLFSGCLVRQRRAIEDLIKTPQNNFRIFRDLILVYGQDERGDLPQVFEGFFPTPKAPSESVITEYFVGIILKALNQPSRLNLQQRESEEIVQSGELSCQLHSMKSQCTCKKHSLDSLSVLGTVFAGQRLDSVDSYRALQMARSIHSKNPNLLDDLRTRKIATIGPPQRLASETLDDFFFRKVWEYFVSLTLKDCSIMITLQRVTGRQDKSPDSPSVASKSVGTAVKRLEAQEELERAIESDSDASSDCDAYASDESDGGDFCDLIVDEVTGQMFAVSVAITDLDSKLPLSFPELEKKIQLERDYFMTDSFNLSL